MTAVDAPPTLSERYPAVPGPPPSKLEDVPGWFTPADKMLFAWLLGRQNRAEPIGDLLEIGVYQGRSAIHMASFRRPGEQVAVCDLFDFAREESSILARERDRYASLTQQTFERNFLAFHDELPVILRGLSESVVEHIAPASCRFIHVDASHMYEHVRVDTRSARSLLRPDGIVVFDDYRSEHTPGTAAAVWEAMANDGLKVVCVSSHKFYGTWGDPVAIQDELIEHLAASTNYISEIQDVMGQRLVRVAKAPTAASAAGGRRAPAARQGRAPRWRKLAVALLPPVLVSVLRRSRAAARSRAASRR